MSPSGDTLYAHLARSDCGLWQCMYYGFKKPFKTTLALFCGGLIILGGFEAGMIFAIRVCLDHDLGASKVSYLHQE